MALISSCGKSGASGELVGAGAKNFKSNEVPYGMVYIPSGTFVMGQTDQDITFGQLAQNKQASVSAFFMDETEITNSEYRQFVNWVRDSIAVKQLLGDQDDKNPYLKKGKDGKLLKNGSGRTYIDWKKVGPGGAMLWNAKRAKDKNSLKKLSDIYYQSANDRVFDKNELNVEQLKYVFSVMNLRKAADNKDPKLKRADFIISDTVEVYPDTLSWLRDFAYAQNEPMAQGYFSHPAYNNYPVVGITWRQARAFTAWRTHYNDAYREAKKLPKRMGYQLPSEAEFEYAARGGRTGTTYPWGGPYPRNAKGCLMANFKPGRGNYADDGGAFTVNVKSYFPNDFGLYNMAGNVAEWTSSTFNESAYTITNDMNPTFSYNAEKGDPKTLRRKVVRGGSWKDIGYFLQNSARTYEYQDEAKSFIGFRCVTPYIGRDIKDK
jgi:hypothetical protein